MNESPQVAPLSDTNVQRRRVGFSHPEVADNGLVLQGGGALGSYQAGVYEALAERYSRLDWVLGVSIGAINAALIAGNAAGKRVERLREFWQLVSSAPAQSLPSWIGDRAVLNQFSAASAITSGIPGFFEPRISPAFFMGRAARILSFYDTAPLKGTLERLVDFDRINSREMRFAVGAVNVRSGNSVYFDNSRDKIGPEHIMASGALPPGFAPVHIDGEDYWDGGLVSNTPLQYLLDNHDRRRPLIALQVDLFSASGAMPTTMAEVLARQKDIQYSSRTRLTTDVNVANLKLQKLLAEALERLPESARRDPQIVELCAQMHREPIDIVQLIYRHAPYELDAKDYEFSRWTVEEHWRAGMHDMRTTFEHPEWLRPSEHFGAVRTFDLNRPEGPQIKK